MDVSTDIYLVIALTFAVFSAVAAVGTSIVLGAGFERLRAGFEVIRRQTGFFADAIQKLDKRTMDLEAETVSLKAGIVDMRQTVERVDKQTGFFADSMHSLEQQLAAVTTAKHAGGGADLSEIAPKFSNDGPGPEMDTALPELLQKHAYITVDVNTPSPVGGKDKAGLLKNALMIEIDKDVLSEAKGGKTKDRGVCLKGASQATSEGVEKENGVQSSGLSHLLLKYFQKETRESGCGVTYH